MITHTYKVLRPVVPGDLERARSAETFWTSQARRFERLGRSYRRLRWTCWGLAMLLALGAGSGLSSHGLGYALSWFVGFGVLIWLGILAGELQTRAIMSANGRLGLAIAASEAAISCARHLEQHLICRGKAFVECYGCGLRDELSIAGGVDGPRSAMTFHRERADEMFPTRLCAAIPRRRIWRRLPAQRGAAWFCSDCASSAPPGDPAKPAEVH